MVYLVTLILVLEKYISPIYQTKIAQGVGSQKLLVSNAGIQVWCLKMSLTIGVLYYPVYLCSFLVIRYVTIKSGNWSDWRSESRLGRNWKKGIIMWNISSLCYISSTFNSVLTVGNCLSLAYQTYVYPISCKMPRPSFQLQQSRRLKWKELGGRMTIRQISFSLLSQIICVKLDCIVNLLFVDTWRNEKDARK